MFSVKGLSFGSVGFILIWYQWLTSKVSPTKPAKQDMTDNKTRKKREELSISATKSIKKENIEIVVTFD